MEHFKSALDLLFWLLLPFYFSCTGSAALAAAAEEGREATDTSRIFAVVPKLTPEPFFDDVAAGCSAEALRHPNAECRYVGTQTLDAQGQASVIDRLIEEGNISGLAVAVIDVDITGAAIDRAVEASIPVITFDSDAPGSRRFAHIGTNDFELGQSFAWLLSAYGRRNSGNFAVISSEAPNLDERVDGIFHELEETFADSQWTEIVPPTNCQNSNDKALEQMYELASDPNLDAIVSVGGWPMWVEPSSRWKDFVDSNRHLLLFVADAAPVQVKLMNEGYADALVGQKPIEIGELIIQTFVEHSQTNSTKQQQQQQQQHQGDDLDADEIMIFTGEQIFLRESPSSAAAAFYELDYKTQLLSFGVFVAMYRSLHGIAF